METGAKSPRNVAQHKGLPQGPIPDTCLASSLTPTCHRDKGNEKMFRVGMKAITEEGAGQILYVNTQKHTVKVQLEGQKTKIFPWDKVEQAENG